MNETRAGSNAEAHEPEMMHLKNRKKLWLIPAAAAGTGAGSVYWIYRYIFHSPRKNQDDDHDLPIPIPTQEQRDRCISLIDALNAKPYERVSILSHDGLRLSGRYYHTADGAPLAILCHGYRGTPSRDFCGGANICLSRGFNVLMIEERAHCSSEGHTISFGINERYDVLNWTRYAAERFGPDTKILLGGISMGAATVLMASELGLPQNVRGILADCPYTTPEEIITLTGKKLKVPMEALFPFVRLAAKLFGGFTLGGVNAASAVRHTKVPVLLIHGEADELVPCRMGREIATANPAMVELHTFPGAGHGLSYLTDTPRYSALIDAFCKKIGI
ncbi:MAG: alpha/beta hydrolase [Oscillospiraceae bacterium]|nr:alpha/beta hydrolase [Oscillospiraceae bacterium]